MDDRSAEPGTRSTGSLHHHRLSVGYCVLLALPALGASCSSADSVELDVVDQASAPVVHRTKLPARIEAEGYARLFDTTTGNSGTASCSSTDVDAQTTTDPNGGTCNIGWAAAGEWLEYDVNVASSAQFDITARLASHHSDKSVHIEIDGKNVTGAMTAPANGWQSFADVVVRSISIAAGNHNLRLAMDTDSINVNYLNFEKSGNAPPRRPPRALSTCRRRRSTRCIRRSSPRQGISRELPRACTIFGILVSTWSTCCR